MFVKKIYPKSLSWGVCLRWTICTFMFFMWFQLGCLCTELSIWTISVDIKQGPNRARIPECHGAICRRSRRCLYRNFFWGKIYSNLQKNRQMSDKNNDRQLFSFFLCVGFPSMIPLSLKKSQDLFGATRGIAILRVPIRIGWELVEPTWLVVWNIWIIFP